MVAVDVDGTLLDTEFDDTLAPRTIAALDAVRAAGHVLALCTGRNTRSVNGLLEKSRWAPGGLPMVLLNGALVKGGQPVRELSKHVLEEPDIGRLIALFKACDVVPMVYGTDEDGGVLHYQTCELNDILARYIDARRQTVGAILPTADLAGETIPRALEVGTIDHQEKIATLTARVNAEMGGRVNVINTRSLLGGGAYYWAEVYKAGCDKGTGVRTLGAEVGIPDGRIVAIGDNYNDLDMFAVAGFSVAMAGSPDEVLAAADGIAPPVGEHGAARVLEDIAAGVWPPAHKGDPS